MDPIIAIVSSGIVSIVLAYITAHQKTASEFKKERAKAEFEVIMRQKHEYFYPFKHCADEFRRRLIHIEQRLRNNENATEKYDNMIKRFRQDFKFKKPEWFYNDKVGPEGGYFITTTIYLNCLLFYWIKRIEYEHPFISLEIRNTNTVSDALKRYEKYLESKKHLSTIKKENCDIYDFLKNIKLAIALDKGIPFALHDSIGDFMYNHSDKKLVNYDEFCEQLRDDSKRVKFIPVLNFWTNLVNDTNKVDEERLHKVSVLIAILEILKDTDVRQKTL